MLRSRDRGSVLLLVPACVLVMLVLASLAVDLSLAHMRQRQAFDLAAAAANDAATAGADPASVRRGDFTLDPARVDSVVSDVVAASELAPHLAEPPVVRVVGDQVSVELAVKVDYLFSGAMPGAPDSTVVRGRASAVPVAGGFPE